MAKIVYGICGAGHGHVMRALAVMSQFPQHDFLAVTWGDALPILDGRCRVLVCPNPESPVVRHRVDVLATVRTSASVLARGGVYLRRVRDAVAAFGADVAISDWEFFVPKASRALGIPCLSLDHQHVIASGSHDIPWRDWPSFWSTLLSTRCLYSSASAYLATSFYRPLRQRRSSIQVVPPLLRPEVLACVPRDGDHVVAYQGYTTFDAFVALLASSPRPVVAYGPWPTRREGNIRFERFFEADFLESLASCAYVVCGGGHSLISEALFLGKPVLSFPITNQYEQTLNALYLSRLGLGQFSVERQPGAGLLADFEASVPEYRAAIRRHTFCGNRQILDAIAHFVEHGVLPSPTGA